MYIVESANAAICKDSVDFILSAVDPLKLERKLEQKIISLNNKFCKLAKSSVSFAFTMNFKHNRAVISREH